MIVLLIRDWSLITGRGGYKMGKLRVQNFLRPPPSRQGKTFRAPPFKEWKLFTPPPYNMAKTSSYHVKTTPKLFVPPPSAWLKLFRPPLFVGVKLHVPPPPVLLPPLPLISDQSLIGNVTVTPLYFIQHLLFFLYLFVSMFNRRPGIHRQGRR